MPASTKSAGASRPSGSRSAASIPEPAAAAAAASASASSSASTSASTMPDPKTDLPAYLLRLQSALQPLTRNAAAIPTHGDLAFHRSMDRKLAKKLDAESNRLLESISHLASWIAADSRAPKIPLLASKTASSKSKSELDLDLADITTTESFASNLGELVDHLLESADTCLDEYTGRLAPRNLANPAAPDASTADATSANARQQAMSAVQNGKPLPKTGNLPAWVLNAPIPPPQRNFTTKPDNSPNTLWQPHLKYGKPNAQVALGHLNPPRLGADGQPLPRGPRRGMYCAEGDPLDNPYYHEILHSDPPTHALSKPDPRAKDTPPPPLNEKDPALSTDASPFQWVSTKLQIEQLRDHLDEPRVQEIAIDLEHHSYRTYQGVVCLMQLSTRWGDWIIDTLSVDVRQHAELLNSSFTHPDKVKVLHGANHDVLWLQRDLGLYLVNLFDTYHATNVLLFPSHGLNYLMARYCNFDADKRYQLADWRIRPLPKEMLYYARSDTHTLLYIYDNLRHELMEAGGVAAIQDVFTRSKEVAMATYAKEEWDAEGETREGWRSLWRKWGGEAALGTEERTQLSEMKREERLVRALHRWRDGVARDEDESPRYVLGANNLMMLAARAPTKPEGVLACIPPNAAQLKKRVKEIAQLIETEVEAWQKDQDKASEQRRKKLEDSLAADEEADMDLGETVARPPAADKAVARPAISAMSDAARSDSRLNADVWAEAAPARKTVRGTVRSLASNLFGRSNPAAAAGSQLSAPSSKLFGAHAEYTRADTAQHVDAIKAEFVGQVGSLLSPVPSPLADFDAIPAAPLAPATSLEPSAASVIAPTEATADDDGVESESEKDDYIVVSAAGSKGKSKGKAKSKPAPSETAEAGEALSKRQRKELKKRKAQAAGETTPDETPPKKRKTKFEGEFDFATAPNAFESPVESKPKPARAEAGARKEGKKQKSKDKDADPSIFRQPRDRARRNIDARNTM